MKDAKYDDFKAEFQWPDRCGHVVGTPYGIVFSYAIWGGPGINHTRMVFVYANRTYAVSLKKTYAADGLHVRLARQFAKETVARFVAAGQEAA